MLQHLQPSSLGEKSIFLTLAFQVSPAFLPVAPKCKLHLHSLPFCYKVSEDASPGSRCLLVEVQKGKLGKAMNEDKSIY